MWMNIKNRPIKIGLYACIAIFLLIFPLIAKSRYQVHILNMCGIYILLSLGLNIAMGFAGQFNLAMGALWGIGGYTAGILSTKFGWSFWVNLPIAMLFAGLVGAFVGLPSLKVRAHYLSIVTIGLGEVINLILINQEDLTGGVLGISGMKRPVFFGIPLDSEEKYYYLILIIVILGYLLAKQIVANRVGRSFRAIRDDPLTAQAMGVNIGNYKILAFFISAVFAGAAGALYAHLNAYISPDIFEIRSTMFIMTMTMVGGMGNLTGSIIGGVLLPILQEYLRAIQNWQLVGYGLIIMLVVLFIPGGIMQLVQRNISFPKIKFPWLKEKTVEGKKRRSGK
jgi:branched-chain amino acid transport system permease protein